MHMIESCYISPTGSVQNLSGGTIGVPVLERVMMTLLAEWSAVEESIGRLREVWT